jgi:transcription elongation factor Elf1
MRKKTEVICPSCHEAVDVIVDLAAGSRSYVEECSICDEPMRLRVHVSEDEDEVSARAEPAGRAGGDDEHDEEILLESTEVTCPACWETVELSVDLSAGSQTYTEDCTVCCRPMTVRVWVSDDLAEFTVEVESESD